MYPPKPGPSEITVTPFQAYRIRRKWQPNLTVARHSYSYFIGTRQQCALRMAWWRIMEKYPDIDAVDRVGTLECDCLDDNDTYRIGALRCPLHDRHCGYFKRLADRLAARIANAWVDMPVAGLQQYREERRD